MYRICGEMRVVNVICGAVLLLVMISGVKAEVGDYTHEWAVHVEGGDEKAHNIARRHDFDVVTKIFHDVYLLRHRRVARRSADPSQTHHHNLMAEPHVRWAEQQVVKRRVKRDFLDRPPTPFRSTWMDDPKWPQMWYLNRGGSLDMNVQAAWAEGVTGKGVVVTILDDGLEKDHPDLIKNYDPNASYDVNSHDQDPMPRYDLVDSNRHGTRCAGEVAAGANNSICAVGVAFEASVGGVRMLDGDVTDAVEARSLALNPQHIDIYSASWGPDDDGKTVDGPGQLATRAFVEGIRNGRGGKGSIFVWASGNGGRDQDNCNCDGYTNSIWTLSISSATEKGRVPWYSEACSSTLATTYSSGSLGERQIITTDLHHSCTSSHTGTSASAPLAAAICALALQVNRDITWRDMQHIVVRTARPENLEAPDWQTNGVGRQVSHRFGYGLMDSYGMVQLARNWTSVPTQRKCEVNAPHVEKLIPQKSFVTLELDVTDCPGVSYLEHVQAKVSLTADRRGDIEIYLSSPAGTKSTLLAQRPHDNSRSGFHSWPFLTVHMWGERPLGKWKLEIHNNGHFFTTGATLLEEWTLIFHGTRTNTDKWQARGGRRDRGGGGVVGLGIVPISYPYNPPTTPTTTSTTSSTTPRLWHLYQPGNPLYPIPSQSPQSPDYKSLPASIRPPNHRDSSHHKGKAEVFEWSLTMYGTETEPGQAVTPQGGELPAVSPIDPTPPQVVDPTEGNTSTRDPGTKRPPGLPSSASPTPAPLLLKLGSAQRALPPGCSRVDTSGACLECERNAYLLGGKCLQKCPENYYGWNPQAMGATESLNCRPCHYSCRSCSGPQDYECTVCWGDAELYSPSEGQKHCHPLSLLNAYRSQQSWYVILLVILLGLLLVVLFLAVLVFRAHKTHLRSSIAVNSVANLGPLGSTKSSSNGNTAYTPVARGDSEQLITKIPFHDLTSDEEI
ncbi:furin-like protease kpc-1 isoform X2 [Procambarus clarkii]|uniref:furin-like protease kpc-1 isoform X2 n=1 Tax=Procambarus clarkii TaxID=6728 RepID=UPI001E6732E7|nr:furin-like protease 1, isoforms 1/1-X/2 isoform X2 [Procambarus clarkii]